MRMTEDIGALMTALAKAQGTIEDAGKDSVNPHFKSRYATLAAVRQAVVDEARANYRQGPGGGAEPIGINQFGVPVVSTGSARTMRALSASGSVYVRRSWASV